MNGGDGTSDLHGGAHEAAVPAALAAAAAPVPPDQPWAEASLQGLRAAQQRFAAERDWGQYHTPRNLLLALVGEAGELAECFQWKGEVLPGLPGFSAEERQLIGAASGRSVGLLVLRQPRSSLAQPFPGTASR